MLSQAGRVRLDTEEIDALAYALDGLAPERVALFGSRVEPDRRGGDVDLLNLRDAPACEQGTPGWKYRGKLNMKRRKSW